MPASDTKVSRGAKQGSSKSNRQIRIWLIVGAAASVFFLSFFYFRKPDSPEAVAQRVAHALLSGDADSVLAYVQDYELKQMGIDRLRARSLLVDLILPRFQNLEGVVWAQPTLTSKGMVGAIATQARLPSGRSISIHVLSERTDKGAMVLLRSQLISAWRADYLGRHPEAPDDKIAATLWGLQRDRGRLEELGVKRMPARSEDGPTYSLDEFERVLQITASQRHAKG
jgi:hypothetical protein